MIRYHNRNIPKSEDTKNADIEVENENNEAVNKILKNSESVYNSPSKFLRASNESAKTMSKFSLFSPEAKPIEKSEKIIPQMNLNNEENVEDKAKYENYIYKKSEGNKLKKYYLVLIDKDIYYYKSDNKKRY